jgi:tetratricopeptide (TPR) repeat protein
LTRYRYMFERGYFAEADRLLCNAIPLLEGEDAQSAWLRYSLAGVRNECNRVVEAKGLMDEVIATQEKVLQPDDLALGNAYKSAGVVYMELGELEKAFDLLKNALRISGDVDKAQAAATHANLTHCYLRIKDIDKAIAHAEMSYALSLEACGDNSDRFAE